MFCPEGRIFSSPVCITFGRAKRFQAFRKNFFLRPWPRTRRSPFPSGGRRRPPSHARRLSDEGERTVSASPLIRRSPSSPASRELPPPGEAQTRGNVGLHRRGGACPAPQTVDKVGFLSSRTSDRCHWCGDPHPKSPKNTTFLKKNGLPRQCEHWLAMTCFGVCLHIELPPLREAQTRGRSGRRLKTGGAGTRLR